MCGIIGIGCLGEIDRELEIQRQEIAQYLLTELLIETQTRGPDATGVSVVFDNGNFIGAKSGHAATDFISKTYDGDKGYTHLVKKWSALMHKTNNRNKNAKIVIGHCRKKSVGNAFNNTNNHPIYVEPIVGVHNGTLKNDDEIFEHLGCGRDGQVDSEAIIRLLHNFTDEGKNPFTIDQLKDVTQRLEGSFSVLAANGNNPYQIAFMTEDRPLELCLVKNLNLVLCVSERTFIHKVLYKYKKMVELYPSLFSSIDTKWPSITAADLDYKTVPTLEVGLIDLTEALNDEGRTSLDSIVQQACITRGGRIWQSSPAYGVNSKNSYNSSATNNNYYNKGNRFNQHTAGTKTPPATDKTIAATTDAKIAGLLWSEPLKKFQRVSVKEIQSVAGGLGFLEIEYDKPDSKTKEAGPANGVDETADAPTDTKEKVESILKEQKWLKDNREYTTGVALPIIEKQIPVGDEEPDTSAGRETVLIPEKHVKKVAVDVTKLPEAVKATEKFKKQLKKCSSHAEACEELEFDDIRTMEELDTLPLINRARKRFMANGYYLGYRDAMCSDDYNDDDIIDGVIIDKGKKRDKAISTYKFITKIMAKIIEGQTSEETIGSTEDYIMASLTKEGKQVDINIFNRLYTKKDIEDNEILGKVKAVITELNNKTALNK